MHKLKSMLFSQLTLLSNNLILTSYLSGIYLESGFFFLWGGVQKTPKKEENRQKKNTEEWRERKTKNKRKVKYQQYTSLVLNYILPKNIIWKKDCLYHRILFTVFMHCRIFETLMIHWIWMYINVPIII